MKNYAAYLCGRYGGNMLSAETGRDHIHLLVSMPPDVVPSRLVTTLKTQLSKEVCMAYSNHVRKYIWGRPLSGAAVISLPIQEHP